MQIEIDILEKFQEVHDILEENHTTKNYEHLGKYSFINYYITQINHW